MSDLTPDDFKKQKRWVKVFLSVALVSGVLALLQAVHLHFDPMAERHYGKLIHVHIGERDFAIPSEYFRGPIPHGNTDRLHLWVMMPNYAPYRGEISGGRAQIDAGWERHLIVDIKDVRAAGDVTTHYERQRIGLSTFITQDVADAHGMHRTVVWRSTPRSPKPFIDHDLYYENANSGDIRVFISCDRDEPGKIAICSFHDFQDGLLLYSLAYRKSNLPKWKDIQTGVHDLIQSFSCVSYSELISTKKHNGEKQCPR